MTFSLREISRWFGQPVAHFRFERGALVERYTSADRPIIIGAEQYSPISIARGPIREGVDAKRSNVTITLPLKVGDDDVAIASWWRPYPPSDPVIVTCMAQHYGDADVTTEWIGRVVAPSYTDTTLKLTCEPSRTSGRRSGLQLKWQRGCPLALYSQGLGMCNVDKEQHALPAVLAGVTGLMLTAPEFATLPVGRLAGGYIEWRRADGLKEFRTIMAHTGSAVVVNYGAADLEDGLELVAYPGCAHNWADCTGYFENGDNYGGSMYLPVKNLFDGNPVW
ncbi:TPA: phage BR0599 family protein [Stenotrophomonas maltophilia]|nr:phage BR0599 family protein [Stenotrophomonas maltophilia]